MDFFSIIIGLIIISLIVSGLFLLLFKVGGANAKKEKERKQKAPETDDIDIDEIFINGQKLREYNENEYSLISKGMSLENVDIEQAIACYEEVLDIKSHASRPYKRLAIIYRKQNRLDDEIRVLRQYIDLMPAEHVKNPATQKEAWFIDRLAKLTNKAR